MALSPAQQTNVVNAFLASWLMAPGGYTTIFDDAPELADDPMMLTEFLFDLNPAFQGQSGSEFYAAYMMSLFNGMIPDAEITALAEAFAQIEDLSLLSNGDFAYLLFQAMADGDWSGEGLEAFAAVSQMLQNQQEVADYGVEQEYSETDFEVLQNLIAGVTDDPTTVDEARQVIDGQPSPGPTPGPTPGETFTFTTAVGELLEGTTGDDLFRGVLDGDAGADGTFNTGDALDGKGGMDTFNLLVTASSTMPAGFVVENANIVNITHEGTSGALDLSSSQFTGVEQLWQIDNTDDSDDFQDVSVGSGVTAGFRSTGSTSSAATVSATVYAVSDTQNTIAAAVDGVDDGSQISFDGSGLETVTVSGNVAGSSTNLSVSGDDQIVTLNLGITDNTRLNLDFSDVTAVNASSSTGNFTASLADFDDLMSYVGGTGGESVTFDLEQGNDVTVDMGAGNDVITLDGSTANSNKASTIALGAGNDTVDVDAIANIFDADEADFMDGLIKVSDFSATSDVLDVEDINGELANNTLQSNIDAAASLYVALGVAAEHSQNSLVFGYDGNTYVYYDQNDTSSFDSGDGLIEITGLTVSDLSEGSNFIS